MVLDYYTEEMPTPTGSHNPVFLRVNDRPCPGTNCWSLPAEHELYRWTGTGYEEVPPYSNQTRFGTFVYRSDQPTGVLQFQGDSIDHPGSYEQGLPSFTLSEEPFQDTTGKLFRNQIIEKEEDTLFRGYLPTWRAEVWDLTNGSLLGASNWISFFTVQNYYRMYIPARSGSRVMIGLGPGNGGTYGAERVGTAYWLY